MSVVCPDPVDTPMLDVPSHGINVRRYLTDAAGPAIAPGTVGDAGVRAVTKNRAVVAPERAASVWLAARLAPGVAAAVVSRSMRKELARR